MPSRGAWFFRQHATRRRRLVLLSLAFLVALAYSKHLLIPRSSIPTPFARGQSGIFPLPNEVAIHSTANVIDKWPRFSMAEQRLNRQVLVHRGLSGNFCGKTLPESSAEAGLRALDRGFAILEVDVTVDRDENLIIIHDKNGFRQTRGRHLWRHVRFDELPDRLKRYVWRKIESGQYTDEVLETSFIAMSLDDYIAKTVASYPGATLLLDCRDGDSIPAIRHLSNQPHLFGMVIVQVYDFGFRSGSDFFEQVQASGAAAGWQNIHLVISPHPDGIKKLPNLDANDAFNANATLAAVWQWAQSFENLGLKIFGADVPQTGFFRYYNPISRKVFHDNFEDENLSDEERLAVFYDWILHQFALDYKERYPNRMILAPASSYTIGVAGRMLRSAFHTGQLTELSPDDLRHRMFLDASLPQTVFECGADAAISDRPYDAVAYLATGKSLDAPEGYRYLPAEIGKFGWPDLSGEITANGRPSICYPESIVE